MECNQAVFSDTLRLLEDLDDELNDLARELLVNFCSNFEKCHLEDTTEQVLQQLDVTRVGQRLFEFLKDWHH